MKYIDIQKNYLLETSVEHRKKFAQFFTPEPIAKLMSEWLFKNKSLQKVLDPACGLGVFSDILLSKNINLKIVTYETDEIIYNKSKGFLRNSNVKILLEDFIFSNDNEKYDGIICNPPYLKFHDYDNKKYINKIEKDYNVRLSGFTNLYALFLIKSLYKLNNGAKLAFIIPSEFMNSDYGVIIKKILLDSKMLRYIININLKNGVFADAITTSCIVLCSNDDKCNDVVFYNANSISELEVFFNFIKKNERNIGKVIPFLEIDYKIKWRNYYQNHQVYKNLMPFGKIAKVTRGIATGSNDFFTLSKEKADEYNIPANFLIPCICKANDVKSLFFTENNFMELKEKNKNIYLLHAENSIDENVIAYIKIGEEMHIHQRHLTSKRKPWYALEKRKPAPIWVSVFNRSNLKFIRNETNTLNLTAFHCIYLKDDFFINNISIDLFFAYLITDVAKDIFNKNKREYGNGLNKFEPNDLNNAHILDLSVLDASTSQKILNLYYDYRDSEMNNAPNSELISQINELFKKFYEIND